MTPRDEAKQRLAEEAARLADERERSVGQIERIVPSSTTFAPTSNTERYVPLAAYVRDQHDRGALGETLSIRITDLAQLVTAVRNRAFADAEWQRPDDDPVAWSA